MNTTNGKSGPSGTKGRMFLRVQVKVAILLKVVGDPRDRTFSATTRNLSRGGMCLLLEKERRAFLEAIGGTLPRLQIATDLLTQEQARNPAMPAFWINAQVSWLRPPADGDAPLLLGVMFSDLQLSAADKITTFITETLRKKQDTLFDRKKNELLARISRKK